jgi:hypothetical protein
MNPRLTRPKSDFSPFGSTRMKLVVVSVGLVFIAVVSSTAALGQPRVEAPRPRIGRVIVVGNTVTSDQVIRRAVNLFSGDRIRATDLRPAEKRLERLGIFEMNAKLGGPPTVKEIPTDDANIQDILVVVKEKSNTKVRLDTGVNSNGDLVVRLVLEERNFDPQRLPNNVDDILEGRAFRGAGETLYLELLQVPVLRLRAPFFLTLDNVLHPGRTLPLRELIDIIAAARKKQKPGPEAARTPSD